ncbi:MAG: ABC transporter ATP-binding protein [Planctomycetaceae bacterium]
MRACLYFGLSSLLLCLALVTLFCLVDVLVRGGRLQITPADQTRLSELVGPQALAAGADGQPAGRDSAGELVYVNRGLLPTVWAYRDRWFWGRATAALYRMVPPLRSDVQALLTLVVAVAVLGWLRSMLDSRARLILMRAAQQVAGRLRQSIHRQTLRLGPSDLEGRSSQQAYELFTTEVDRLRDGIFVWAERIGRDPLQLGLLLALGLAVDPRLAIVCLAPTAVCWYLAQREQRRIEEHRRLSGSRSEKELKLLAESLEKTRLVRGFAMETFDQQQFSKHLQRFQDNTQAALATKAWSRRAVRMLSASCVAVVLFFVGSSILSGSGGKSLSFALGALMVAAFVLAAVPLRNLIRLRDDVQDAETAASRVQTYLNLIPEVGQAVGAKFLQPLSRILAFENVSYTTPGRQKLLDGLNLKIPAGRTIALVASDPLEALAVAYLIPRFIEPQEGRILIDGEDIAWVTLESLRAEAMFVGGKDPFLTATIRENISGGSDGYSLPEVTEAAKIAHAHNFISKLPQGYETQIGEHGEQLDAGQAFRLSLARAVLRKPALLIVEEPSEAFDEDTKALLDDAYKRVTLHRTVVFLARRLSTVKRADEIVLIHRGRLAAIGPHSRLVQSSALYRHWEYINFNEFRQEFESA